MLAPRRGLLSALAAAAVAAAALLAGGMPWFIDALHAAEHGLPATWIGMRLGRGRRLFRAGGAGALLLAAAAVAAVPLWSARTGGSLTEVIERQLIETCKPCPVRPVRPVRPGASPAPKTSAPSSPPSGGSSRR